MKSLLKTSLLMLLALTLLTGVAYPLLITGLAQLFFNKQAHGSLLYEHEKLLGSELIGQPFADPKYFWSRPSATAAFAYNAAASSGSNLGPTNPVLLQMVQARVQALRAADPNNTRPIPVDLVTASASGLDPDISPAAAFYQVPRVARARGLDEAVVRRLVESHIAARQFGVLGEPRVKVLQLNLALTRMHVAP